MSDPLRIIANSEGYASSASLEVVRLFLVISGRSTDDSSRAELIAMAERGEISTWASPLYINGRVQDDPTIPPAAWSQARLEDGIDWDQGALACTATASGSEEWLSVRARNIAVNLNMLGDLIPLHVDTAWGLIDDHTGKRTASRPDTHKSAGRKPDYERWKVFWLAVVELAQEGRLNSRYFPSQARLKEEVLTMMGKSQFSDDYVRDIIGQIYKKFVGEGN